MSEQICRIFHIRGHVQGVFFRASTRDQALHLGVTGYAHNLRDGRVEVLACGGAESVEALAKWLRIGPPTANVESVRESASERRENNGFQVG